MKNAKIRTLTLSALFAALTTVATIVIQIPTPTKGYINLGDCIVNLSAWILPPFYGAAAGGIGSAMADIISGYAIYAPATLIIKSLMALASALIFRKLSRKGDTVASKIVAATVAELIMSFGYIIYDAILCGSLSAAFVNGISGNIIQGMAGIVGSVLLYELVFKRIPKSILTK